jgi:hypothetical protein
LGELIDSPIYRLYDYIEILEKYKNNTSSNEDYRFILESIKLLKNLTDECIKLKTEAFKEKLLDKKNINNEVNLYKYYEQEDLGFVGGVQFTTTKSMIKLDFKLNFKKLNEDQIEKLEEKEFRKTLDKPILAKNRPTVWWKLINYMLSKEESEIKIKDKYEDILEEVKRLHEDHKYFLENVNLFFEIDPFFIAHPLYTDTFSELFDSMKRIIISYYMLNKNFVYQPAICSYLGIFLLLFTELRSFWMFKYFLEKILPENYFDINQTGLWLQVETSKKLIEINLKEINDHFIKLGFKIEKYLIIWLETIFIGELPIEIVMKIIDQIIINQKEEEGFMFIFRIIIALLKLNEKLILQQKNFEELLILFNSIMIGINETKLFTMAKSLNKKTIENMVKKIRSESIETVNNKLIIDTFLYENIPKEKTFTEKTYIDLFNTYIREEFSKIVLLDEIILLNLLTERVTLFNNKVKIQQIYLMLLSEYHEKKKQYAESSQCKMIYLFNLIQNYGDFKIFSKVSLESLLNLNLNTKNNEYIIDKNSDSENFNFNIFENAVNDILVVNEKAGNYEHSIILSNFIIQLSKNEKLNLEYEKKIKNYEEKLKEDRYFEMYYRVRMYGKKLLKENGKDYIFKFPKFTKLYKVVTYFKESLSYLGTVEVLDHSKAVGSSYFEDFEKIYIQITFVKPYFNNNDLALRKTDFDMNFNIDQFYYTTPFIPITHENLKQPIAKVHIQKTILTTKYKFPFISVMNPIKEESVIVLTPIESSIQNLNEKIQNLEKSLEKNEHLEMNIQGSVCAVVNGGPSDIIQVFLGSKNDFDEELIKKLSKEAKKFLEICEKCVLKIKETSLNTELIQKIEEGNTNTKLLFSQYLIEE